MYSEQDLEAAVAAGALSRGDAQALRDYVAAARQSPAVDEEHFRLITGFNDFFVAIAAAILLIAVAWIGNEVPPHIDEHGPSPFAGLFVAGAAWGLAEFFTRKRRMALPSIMLLLAFAGGVFLTSALTLSIAIVGDSNASEATFALIVAASAAITVAATWFHWRRFHVPITVAAGAAAAAGVALGLLGSVIGDNDNLGDILLTASLILGIAVFALAMRWDASDPRRETRRSDVAFWLHLLAAPLIVHPIFSLLGLTDGGASMTEALVVLLVYVALGLAALAVDRRALLVSALAYVLWAMTDLFREMGAVELSFALTALVIGSALLLLSAFWHNARAGVVSALPGTMQARLPARA
mgnify:CR=1 FL=1